MTPIGMLIVSGWLMMMPLPRRQVLVVVHPGESLREVYKQSTQEKVPNDMMDLTRAIAGPLRIIAGGREQ